MVKGPIDREATPEEKEQAIDAFAAAVHHVGRGGTVRIVEPSPGDRLILVTLDAGDMLALMARLGSPPVSTPSPSPPPPAIVLSPPPPPPWHGVLRVVLLALIVVGILVLLAAGPLRPVR